MAEESIMQALDKVLSTYKAGGEFTKQRAEQLKGTERKYTSGAQQGLVSRGLSGTTVAASIPAAFEQEVAAPYRTETERLRSGQEMQGLIAKAGFLEREQTRTDQKTATTEEREFQAQQARLERISRLTASGYFDMPESTLGRDSGRGGQPTAGGAGDAGGPTQHVGSGGQFDLGSGTFNLGEFGITGDIGDFSATTAQPSGGGGGGGTGVMGTPPSMDTLAGGGVMAGQAGQAGPSNYAGADDWAFSQENITKMVEQAMKPGGTITQDSYSGSGQINTDKQGKTYTEDELAAISTYRKQVLGLLPKGSSVAG